MQYLLKEIFYKTGNKIVVKLFKSESCKDCFFSNCSCDNDPDVPECVEAYRFDKKDVYFVLTYENLNL